MLQAIVIAFIVSFSMFCLFIGGFLIFSSIKTNQKFKSKLRILIQKMCVKFYNILYRLVPIAIENLNYSFKMGYILDDTESKIKTSKSIMILILVTGITAILSLKFMGDTMLAMIVTCMMAMYTFNKIKGDGEKFLEALQDSIEDMIHLYNSNNENIDGMFAALLENRSNYVYRYMNQMYETLKLAIIDEANSESIIMQYNTDVPSRHLRLMFNYLYMTYRYGDEVTLAGQKLFNKNMLALQREVNSDLMRVTEIKAGTLGEQWFIMGSVIMIPGATWYMKEFFTFENFETISRFLDGTLGYTIKLICAIYAMMAYYIYMKILDSNHAIETKKSIYWEELLLKNKLLNKLVIFLAPKRETEKHDKILSKIHMVEGYNGIKPFYVRKVLISLIVFISVSILLSTDTYLSYVSVKNDLYRGVASDTMDMVISMEEYADTYKSQAISNDNIIMNIVKGDLDNYNFLSKEGKRDYILQIIRENNIDYGMYPEVAADRIIEKLATLSKLNPWLIVLIAFLSMMVGYQVPNIALNMTLILSRRAMIEDEVIGYYTVVMLLVNHSVSNVNMLMNWLKNFADIYRVRFQQCLDNLSEKEITSMQDMVDNKELKRLMSSILMAFKGTDLKSAFAGIEQRYEFQEDLRRVINQRIIKYRVMCSELLSWSAMGTTFVLYILSPMIYSIYEMLKEIMIVG